jgi:hypothetical protein
MKSWRLKSDEIARTGRRELFSTRELRVDVIDLAGSEEVGETGGSGGVVIEVLSGGVDLTSGDETISCADGTLVALAPGEAGSVRAIEQSRLLLTFSPRPASHGHSPGSA